MTTKVEQAARQLLEAAEGIQHGTDWNNGTHAKIYRPKFPAAITALREALDHSGEANEMVAEQAEQEPVAWANGSNLSSAVINRQRSGQGDTHTWSETKTDYHSTPLYAAPVQQAEREPVALLQLAADALVYHTEQTRPIQNTIDVLAAIQKFKEKQR